MTDETNRVPAPRSPDPVPRGWFRDAVAPRTFLLVLGVFILQLAFVYSYVGAFHQPKPHQLTIDVVAPAAVADAIVAQLNDLPDSPLDARRVDDPGQARENVVNGSRRAALVMDPASTSDTLLVATAAGASVATAIEQILTSVEHQQDRGLAIEDLVPPQPGDARGLTTFYLVIGWLVGGYLAAAALGGAKGARPATLQRAMIRLGSMVPYAILSGLGGAIVVDPLLDALTGNFMTLWGMGALLVFAAAAVTMALQVLFGMIGVGITLLLFVIIGNPSAGGAYPTEMLPPFWRVVGPWLPGGAGVTAIRDHVYFHGHDATRPTLVIVAWCVLGTAVMAIAALFLHRRGRLPGTVAPR